MRKLPYGKDAKKLTGILTAMLLPYKKYVHSITADNGTEFEDHKQIARKLDTKVYFTHPYSSWKKGLIEYTNKLIRQYIPKKLKFKTSTQIFYNGSLNYYIIF